MKILVCDATTEGQAFCARRFEEFSQADLEMLDVKLKLVSDREVADKVSETDVLVLGSGLGEGAISVARQAHAIAPWVHKIMFVTDAGYGGMAFRSAHSVGVRKVFQDSASPLDFLQELVAILSEFRKAGRAREGRVVAIVHAKGGVGATTVAAALAEVCSANNKSALLWDLDIESRDLSRSLQAIGREGDLIGEWVSGNKELTKEAIREAAVPIDPQVSVLTPPASMAEAMDLVCHIDTVSLVQRIVELAKLSYDCLIVDTAGRLGPATGTIMRLADEVVFVIDDTVFGVTAMDMHLGHVKTLLGGATNLKFLLNPFSGALGGLEQIASEIEPAHQLGETPWVLPALFNDSKASAWAGSGHTLYSLGTDATKRTLEEIAKTIKIIDDNGTPPQAPVQPAKSGMGIVSKVLSRFRR
jgi:cellulose biosynthesis protein BcsQ